MDEKKIPAEEKSAGRYPGVAVDIADDEKVSETRVDDETKELNMNPHSDGI